MRYHPYEYFDYLGSLSSGRDKLPTNIFLSSWSGVFHARESSIPFRIQA